MTDSSGNLYRKFSNDRNTNYPRRPNDYYSSPFSHEESEVRITYPMMQPQLQEKKIFGFEIFVDNDILSELEPLTQWFSTNIKISGVAHIRFNSDLTIPDLNGRNIQIFDNDMEKKYQCSKLMLSDIYQIFKKTKKESFSIIVFVPEGMVSLLIGTKGHQINKIMKESHTIIVVNQPINKMTYRTAKIQGYHSDVAKACRIIYQILQEKSSIAYSIQKQPSQLDYTKSKIKSKFIFPELLTHFLQKKKKTLLQKVQEETKCLIRFEDDKENKLLKRDQEICILIGKLEDVQAMLVIIINLTCEYLSQDKKNIDPSLKMLIPANYVTKLIGQKGYMIRDIIQRSGGSQIKILSDKATERDIKECIISINGTRENKIDASCLILEQIQCFKNGGPILQSGKSINQNLAQQFKHSIPAKEEEPEIKNEAESCNQSIEASVALTNVSPISKTIPASNLTKIADKKQVNSQEQGLIEAQEDEKLKITEKANKQNEAQTQIITKMTKPAERDNDESSSSRSRSRQKRVRLKKLQGRKKSESESVQFKHEREYVQVRMVIPKKLSQDQKQLKYIESLSKSEITMTEQRVQGSGESIISIRGTLKQNNYCIKLLQKRLARMKLTTTTSGR